MKGYTPNIKKRWPVVLVLLGILLFWTFYEAGVEAILGALFPTSDPLIYQRSPMSDLMLQHLILVAIGATLAISVGVIAGLLIVSPIGRPFRDLVLRMANFGQSIPSIALMAILVPLVGYGTEPVIIALVVFSILPVMVNTVAGIEGVPEPVIDAGRGMGMTRQERLRQLQIPIAMPVIMTGVRTMLVILISAAALGAVVGAGGLGVPIMSGIGSFNNAVIIYGAIPAILLALLVDQSL
jgi:osmoprotectant transport system permease protein